MGLREAALAPGSSRCHVLQPEEGLNSFFVELAFLSTPNSIQILLRSRLPTTHALLCASDAYYACSFMRFSCLLRNRFIMLQIAHEQPLFIYLQLSTSNRTKAMGHDEAPARLLMGNLKRNKNVRLQVVN